MRRILKDHFIPHEGNEYQPHFLRFRIAFSLLAMVLVLEGAYLVGTTYVLPRSDNFAAIFASVLVEETNVERAADALQSLTVNPKLEFAARLKAEDMAEKGYFAHNSPDGKTPWYFFKEAGYDYAAAGENLAVNFTDSKDVTEAWMRSPTHRANIMNGNYTEIGIATAVGTYKGKSAIFVVQEFGRPAIVARDIPSATSSAASLIASVSTVGTQPPESSVTASQPAVSKEATTPATDKPARVVAEPPTTVAGIETTKLEITPIETTSTPLEVGVPATPVDIPEVVPVATQPLPTPPSVVEKIVASPRSVTTSIFIVLVAILTFALGLAIFIKVRIQYPHMIANTILIIAIILSLVLLNFALGFSRGVI